MTAISVIMPCYNRAYDLRKVLNAYDFQNLAEPFEVIAVDDASKDGSYELLMDYQPNKFSLRVIRMDQNKGQGAARNQAIPLAQAPLVLFVGDDIYPDKNFLEAHLTAHRRYKNENIAILGKLQWPGDILQNTLMTHIDGVGAQQFSFYYLQNDHEYDFRHFYTSNLSLKKQMLLSMDRLFDPDFVMYGYEDAELGYRLSKKGMRIIYQEAALAYHYHYHNIFTFAARQYKSGLMACVLVKKHPQLNSVIYGRRFMNLRLLWMKARSSVRTYSTEDVDWLEAISLRLLSYFEWDKNHLLDPLYIRILDYFYQKGILDGMLNNSKFHSRVRGLHAKLNLSSALAWFIQNALQVKIPLPEGYDYPLLKRLSVL